MASVSTADPHFQSALSSCVLALKRLASYDLDPSLDRRLQDLSERKEFLGQTEHQELLALVAFTQQRTIDRLEARLALQRLQEFVPELVDGC